MKKTVTILSVSSALLLADIGGGMATIKVEGGGISTDKTDKTSCSKNPK